MSNISLTLNTGETLRWNSDDGECVVLRNDGDIVAAFSNLNSKEKESKCTPKNASYLISPKCLKQINTMFPNARLKSTFGRKPQRKVRDTSSPIKVKKP